MFAQITLRENPARIDAIRPDFQSELLATFRVVAGRVRRRCFVGQRFTTHAEFARYVLATFFPIVVGEAMHNEAVGRDANGQ